MRPISPIALALLALTATPASATTCAKHKAQDPDYPFSWETFERARLAGPYAGLAYDAG
jgi:hypothetical protein